jgi:hypothetical protein
MENDRRKPHAETGQNDMPAQRHRHLLARRQETRRFPVRGEQQQGVGQLHDHELPANRADYSGHLCQFVSPLSKSLSRPTMSDPTAVPGSRPTRDRPRPPFRPWHRTPAWGCGEHRRCGKSSARWRAPGRRSLALDEQEDTGRRHMRNPAWDRDDEQGRSSAVRRPAEVLWSPTVRDFYSLLSSQRPPARNGADLHRH